MASCAAATVAPSARVAPPRPARRPRPSASAAPSAIAPPPAAASRPAPARTRRQAARSTRRRPDAASARELDHAQHGARRARAHVLGHGDAQLGRLVAQRRVDALEIDGLHVLAEAAGLVELLV